MLSPKCPYLKGSASYMQATYQTTLTANYKLVGESIDTLYSGTEYRVYSGTEYRVSMDTLYSSTEYRVSMDTLYSSTEYRVSMVKVGLHTRLVLQHAPPD